MLCLLTLRDLISHSHTCARRENGTNVQVHSTTNRTYDFYTYFADELKDERCCPGSLRVNFALAVPERPNDCLNGTPIKPWVLSTRYLGLRRVNWMRFKWGDVNQLLYPRRRPNQLVATLPNGRDSGHSPILLRQRHNTVRPTGPNRRMNTHSQIGHSYDVPFIVLIITWQGMLSVQPGHSDSGMNGDKTRTASWTSPRSIANPRLTVWDPWRVWFRFSAVEWTA